MLEIRPNCEHCGKLLPNHSTEAMICSFECTFCEDCVKNILHNVCPNCGGGLEKRPIRPSSRLQNYPPSDQSYLKPIHQEAFEGMLHTYKHILPKDR